MDSTSDITVGQVVKSRAGRDKGNIFLVLDIIDDKYLYVVDGDIRKLDNPKRKKVKHLIIYNTVVPELKEKIENGTKINNAYIRKLLEPFKIKL
ncbi:MAG: KOW domain-containing RNA-binding protein [Clostridiaceae bacterium]|nr:KOW domain-containing RNA-binding protein [Clostridiaceae bacterium]MBW4858843.1 KOW domain-containing RNA-binding protein [Clostridiaceae bacterium]MBW4869418.1 KOW domain-containing RNA-binding protein [Clostridiaceae bacterium]